MRTVFDLANEVTEKWQDAITLEAEMPAGQFKVPYSLTELQLAWFVLRMKPYILEAANEPNLTSTVFEAIQPADLDAIIAAIRQGTRP